MLAITTLIFVAFLIVMFGNVGRQFEWRKPRIVSLIQWDHLLLGGSALRNTPAKAGDAGSILGLGRSPGEGNGNPLQYSCLGNPMDRGACGLQSMGWQKSQTQLSN